jgi:hypothetical protein
VSASGGQFQYTDDEWRDAAPDRPLSAVDHDQLLLLHRHWIWANWQREQFDAELRAGRTPEGPPPDLVSAATTAMFLWYALVWSVIEAFRARRIELGGRFEGDIESIGEDLRRCRNAVFHVSDDSYYDSRLFDFMADPDSAARIRRISTGFARPFLEEFEARKADEGQPDST